MSVPDRSSAAQAKTLAKLLNAAGLQSQMRTTLTEADNARRGREKYSAEDYWAGY